MLKNIDKKLLNYIIIGFGSLFALIIIIVIMVNLFAGKYKSYEEVENMLRNAAREYYKNNTSLLPLEENQSVTTTYTVLVNSNLIKPLEELLKDGKNCSANIIVTKTKTDYDYSAYLDCGEDYRSIELYKVITNPQNIVTSNDGLYQMDNEYVFRGESPNNYLTLSNKTWRILKVDANNNVVLINPSLSIRYVWDDRYNINYEDFVGINDFDISRIKDGLIELYKGTEVLNETDKHYVINRQWCIGKRSPLATKAEGNVDCSALSNESFHFGLITPYEYLMISLDDNCQKADDYSCINYNYLSGLSGEYWTLNASSENTRDVFTTGAYGLSKSRAYYEKKLGIVVYLNSNVMFKKGTGTTADPYTLR